MPIALAFNRTGRRRWRQGAKQGIFLQRERSAAGRGRAPAGSECQAGRLSSIPAERIGRRAPRALVQAHGMTGLLRNQCRKRREQFAPIARIAPMGAVPAKMEAAASALATDFLRRRMPVDDDLRSAGELDSSIPLPDHWTSRSRSAGLERMVQTRQRGASASAPNSFLFIVLTFPNFSLRTIMRRALLALHPAADGPGLRGTRGPLTLPPPAAQTAPKPPPSRCAGPCQRS